MTLGISGENQSGATFRRVVLFASVYVALAFAFSFVGFVAQQPTVHFHEYSFPEAIEELGGHFLFGAVAVAPFLSFWKSLVGGAFAIGIDADHVLGALNLNVSSRPDHSIFFAIFAAAAIWAVVRLDKSGAIGAPAEVAVLVPITVLSHLSYDIFAAFQVFKGVGFSFPILSPFSFSLFAFPYWTWIPLEASALISSVVLAVWFRARSSPQLSAEPRGHEYHELFSDSMLSLRNKYYSLTGLEPGEPHCSVESCARCNPGPDHFCGYDLPPDRKR